MVADIEWHPFSKSLDPPLQAYAMETENALQLELIGYQFFFFKFHYRGIFSELIQNRKKRQHKNIYNLHRKNYVLGVLHFDLRTFTYIFLSDFLNF